MATDADALDLSKSILLLEGTKEQQDFWSGKIDDRADYLVSDKKERESVYKVRRDFFVGNHAKYTNIVGLEQKEKRGHANAVYNYAGKTAQKIAYGLANNPPTITYPVDGLYLAEDVDYETEEARTQAVEDFVDTVIRKRNQFWKRGYRRGAFNQVILGDYAIKVYPENVGTKDEPVWEIRVISIEKMENLLVGWRGDDVRAFDYVISEQRVSVQAVEEQWGIKVDDEDVIPADSQSANKNSAHYNNNEWGMRNVGLGGRAIAPSGVNNVPTVLVREYDDENVCAIKIGKQLVQLVFKDDVTYPKMGFWIIGDNIPNPGTNWSMADIDFLIDPNIELNEASNDERDAVRLGVNVKYVAYNMDEFDAESIKSASGGVIYVSSLDGSSRFEVLPTTTNTYPADSYLNRVKKHIHDMGIPEVTYGGNAGSSGRSKAIDYQSFLDLVFFKRDSWELVLDQVSEKVQQLGYFYFKHEFFTDSKNKEFKVRHPEFDWTDILPVTEADKVVNVLNKVQMGLPFKLAFKELGYRDVDAVISEMRKEAKDPDLMLFRSKFWQYTKGVAIAASETGQIMQPGQTEPEPGNAVNEQNGGPMLGAEQNQGRESKLPMSARGGTTAFQSATGLIAKTRQNMGAQGQ